MTSGRRASGAAAAITSPAATSGSARTAWPAAFLVTGRPRAPIAVAPSGTSILPWSRDLDSSSIVTSSLPTMRPPPVTA